MCHTTLSSPPRYQLQQHSSSPCLYVVEHVLLDLAEQESQIRVDHELDPLYLHPGELHLLILDQVLLHGVDLVQQKLHYLCLGLLQLSSGDCFSFLRSVSKPQLLSAPSSSSNSSSSLLTELSNKSDSITPQSTPSLLSLTM